MENKDASLISLEKPIPVFKSESLRFLLKAARWGKFLAILGFIVSGLMFIGGVLITFVVGMLPQDMVPLDMPFSTVLISVIYVILSVISAIPVFFLNSFCNNAIKAINNGNTENLTMAVRSLKNFFSFIGISTIVILAIYTIIIILVGTAAIMSF